MSQHREKGLIFLLLIVTALFIEGGLRFVLPLFPFAQPDAIVKNELTQHDYIPDMEFYTFATHPDHFNPVLNTINSFGIRGPEIGQKKRYRVLNVGDSFIQADEIEFNNTFGSLLNATFPNIEFISHGISSWAPTVEFSWIYHKGMTLKPDEVNLFLYVNDFYRASTYANSDEGYQQEAIFEKGIPMRYPFEKKRTTYRSIKSTLKSNFKTFWLLDYAKQRVQEVFVSQDKDKSDVEFRSLVNKTVNEIRLLSAPVEDWPPDLAIAVKLTMDMVNNIHTFLANKKIRMNVVFIPFGFVFNDENLAGKLIYWKDVKGISPDTVFSMKGIERYITHYLDQHKIPQFPLMSWFVQAKKERPDVKLFFDLDGHWNTEGHRVVYKMFQKHYSRLRVGGGT